MRLFHVFHAAGDLEPGAVFELTPIPNAWHKDYEGLRADFPEGLSLFGLRHVVPEHPCGPPPAEKMELEHRLEMIRRTFYADQLSRLQALFCLSSLEEAAAFLRDMKADGLNGVIWEVEAESIAHRGDMRLVAPGCLDADLHSYWQGLPGSSSPIWECMVKLPVRMVLRVDTENLYDGWHRSFSVSRRAIDRRFLR